MPRVTEGQRLASFNIDKQQWEEFKKMAKANGTTASRILQEAGANYLGSSSFGNSDHRIRRLEKMVKAIADDVAEIKSRSDRTP
jgi:hypothetical protein